MLTSMKDFDELLYTHIHKFTNTHTYTHIQRLTSMTDFHELLEHTHTHTYTHTKADEHERLSRTSL